MAAELRRGGVAAVLSRARSLAALLLVLLVAALVPAGAPEADAQAANCDGGSDAADNDRGDVDVVFIGAHPDDDSLATATLARLDDLCLKTAVVTATRGEGGANAVSTAGGAGLGALREIEERDAMAILDVDHVLYLDELDFFFTQSSEVTEQIWGRDDTLSKIVGIFRQVKPETIITMNPSANSGHGHHQYIARLATEAFDLTGDPAAYPQTLSLPGAELFDPLKLYYGLAFGAAGLTASVAVPTNEASIEDPSQTYGQLEAVALCEYVTQNFCPPGGRTPATTPENFQLVESRVPIAAQDSLAGGALLAETSTSTALGTRLDVTVDTFEWLPGSTHTVTVTTTNDTGSPTSDSDAIEGRQVEADETSTVAAALAWSKATFDSADRALLARDDLFVDSLSSGGLQGAVDGPLLLTATGALDESVTAELERLEVETVTVLGDELAISAAVAQALTSDGYGVERIGGATRVETAIEIAQAVYGSATTAVLARAYGSAAAPDSTEAFADALAAGGYAANQGVPVLVTPSDGLTDTLRDYLTSSEISDVTIVGGVDAISATVSDEVAEVGADVERVAGGNRAATAVAVATELWGYETATAAPSLTLVEGYADYSWASGFAAASYSRQNDSAILLAQDDGLPPETAAYLDGNGGANVVCGPYVECAGVTFTGASLAVTRPETWTASAPQDIADLEIGQSATQTFTVTVPAAAPPGGYTVVGTLTTDAFTASAPEPIRVVPPVEVAFDTPDWVDIYRAFASRVGTPEFAGLSNPQFVLPVGGTSQVTVTVTNNTATPQAGTVSVTLPAGYTAPSTTLPYTVGPDATAPVVFNVTADPSVEPGRDQAFTQGSPQGDVITLTSGPVTETGELRAVPNVAVPRATTAPAIDGDLSDFPTGGLLDLNRRWEGQARVSTADYSGVGYVAYDDNYVYVAADITDDDVLCTTAPDDVKKLFRTDNVEIGVDPGGNSGISTFTVFKIAVVPCTTTGGFADARAFREADENEGEVEITAPGTLVEAQRTAGGYTLEVRMPRSEMDDGGMPGLQPTFGLNVLPYDAAQKVNPDGSLVPIVAGQDFGQSRFGWSVWGAVQANPYLWGLATLQP